MHMEVTQHEEHNRNTLGKLVMIPYRTPIAKLLIVLFT